MLAGHDVRVRDRKRRPPVAHRTFAPRGSLDLCTHGLGKFLWDVHRGTIIIVVGICGYHLHLRYCGCDVDERFVDGYSLQIRGVGHEDGVKLQGQLPVSDVLSSNE